MLKKAKIQASSFDRLILRQAQDEAISYSLDLMVSLWNQAPAEP
jgi:hypothetical protein